MNEACSFFQILHQLSYNNRNQKKRTESEQQCFKEKNKSSKNTNIELTLFITFFIDCFSTKNSLWAQEFSLNFCLCIIFLMRLCFVIHVRSNPLPLIQLCMIFLLRCFRCYPSVKKGEDIMLKFLSVLLW